MPTLTTLTDFLPSNGASLYGSLSLDGFGNIFGASMNGGANGDGTVFELARTGSGYAGSPSTVVTFSGTNGYEPSASLISDASGDLFGTTAAGGATGKSAPGLVFEIPKVGAAYAGTPTILASFTVQAPTDPSNPVGGLVMDAAGNLFGLTHYGGATTDGVVFEIAKTESGYAGTPTIIASINGPDNAASLSRTYAQPGLVADASGNLFGTTGATGGAGRGTVFEVVKTSGGYNSTPIDLYRFTNGDLHGQDPNGGLVADAAGNLFGTTATGGAGGQGALFEIVKTESGYASTPAVLIAFSGADGATPKAGVIVDAAGNLFGTTSAGGANGDGTVFELAKTGSGYASSLTTLATFNGANGSDPAISLTADAAGNLFGATLGGGANGNGTAFEVTGSGYVSPSSGGGGGGQVLTANDTPGQQLTGGAGADTLNAGHNSVVETGAGGADVFAFGALPWNAGHITDFTLGNDRIDLSALFQASGYTGSDPVADGYVSLQSDGQGGTNVFYDTDGRASGNTIQFRITDLDNVSPTGLSWAQLTGGAATGGGGAGGGTGSSGQVLTASDQPNQTLTGGAGADTLNAGHNNDILVGAGGGDVFAFKYLPWNAGHVSDFTLGSDKLDLSALLQASGYSGTDPVADGYVTLVSDSSGGTEVLYDTDGPAGGNTIQYRITDLDHISPAGLTWAQLSGGAATGGGGTGGGGIGGGGTGGGSGQVLTASDAPHQTLTGGAGNDTLNAGHNDDTLIGNAGADHFVFQYLPWNAGHITDFTPGTDVLDLKALFQQAGYAGTDPYGDGRLSLVSDGAGDTKVYFDVDGPASTPQYPTLITTLDHVSPAQLGPGDWIFH